MCRDWSAAHCVCSESVNYCDKSDENGNITKNSENYIDIIALIGLITSFNLEDLNNEHIKERHLRFVSKVVVHENYEKRKAKELFPRGPDIALLKLNRPLLKYVDSNLGVIHKPLGQIFGYFDPPSLRGPFY